MNIRAFFLLVLSTIAFATGEDCVPRNFGQSSVVCVCNATYCDSVEDYSLNDDNYVLYVSNKDGLRMKQFSGSIEASPDAAAIPIEINRDKTHQSVNGFGSSFTDSAGINIKSLSEDAQRKLLETCYGANGNRYNLGRVPIGSSDFSTHGYSYVETPNDISLRSFALADEDLEYKVPLIQSAQKLSPDLRLVSTAWSAPLWMRSGRTYASRGTLKKEYYQIYANYLIKFLEAYRSHGIDVWAITPGNEPLNGIFPLVNINKMGWLPTSVSDWIVDNLGPTLKLSSVNRTLLLAIDNQRLDLSIYLGIMLEHNPEVTSHIDGIAVHWYTDFMTPPQMLDIAHNMQPTKFLLMTEASEGYLPFVKEKVKLGSWERGTRYFLNIVQNMQHWVTGWIDWNIALDKKGGPNWNKNFVDSPIIVDSQADEFYKQPMFYAIGHFSRFVGKDSIRVDLSSRITDSIAFRTPKGEIVTLLYNGGAQPKNVAVTDSKKGVINLQLSPHSINTLIYKE